jgi:hypothetical protein
LILTIPNSYRRLNRRIMVYMYIRVGYYEDLRAWCSNPHLIPLVRATAGRKLWWGLHLRLPHESGHGGLFSRSESENERVSSLRKKRGAKAIAQKDRFARLLGLLRGIPRGYWLFRTGPAGDDKWIRMWNFGRLGSSRAAVRSEYNIWFMLHDPVSIPLVYWHHI